MLRRQACCLSAFRRRSGPLLLCDSLCRLSRHSQRPTAVAHHARCDLMPAGLAIRYTCWLSIALCTRPPGCEKRIYRGLAPCDDRHAWLRSLISYAHSAIRLQINLCKTMSYESAGAGCWGPGVSLRGPRTNTTHGGPSVQGLRLEC